MITNDYEEMFKKTCFVEGEKNRLLNGAIGLAGETGEVAEIIKKYIFHGRELNKEHLVEELGDVIWYIMEIASTIGVSLDTVLQTNIDKLFERYKNNI